MSYLHYAQGPDDGLKNDQVQPKKLRVKNYGKIIIATGCEYQTSAWPRIMQFSPCNESFKGNNPDPEFGVHWVKSSFESFSPWSEADDAITSWIGLRTGWDGCEGAAPSSESLTAARSFVRRARYARVPEGDPYITSDGEIGFHWDVGNDVATVSFLRDGRYFAFCPRQHDDAVRISGRLADGSDVLDLFEALRAFA